MSDPQHQINLDEWYNATDAAARLSANSKKKVETSYVRTLAKYGKIHFIKLSSRGSLYYKPDVDVYVVEERGEKSGRAKRQKAVERKQR